MVYNYDQLMITTQEHPVIIEHLNMVEEDDLITHSVTTEKQCDPKDYLSKKHFLCIIKSTSSLIITCIQN